MKSRKSKLKYSDYQTELDDILHTLKRIDLKLLQTQPYLKSFQKLINRFKPVLIPLKSFPSLHFSLLRPIGHIHIRRELQKDYSIHVYLDIDQYIHTGDEIIAEFLDLLFHDYGKKLQNMSPQILQENVQIPNERSVIVKIVGERIVMQLRERDLLQAKNELLQRLDEIVWDLYRVKPRDSEEK